MQIEKALAVLGALAERAREGAPVSRGEIDDLVEFFQRFADRCHHAKDENALFPALEARGMPRDAGPLGVMLHEHEAGRALLRALADAAPGCEGDAAGRSRFAGAARAYEELLGAHIHKENEILFRMAERMLDSDADARVAALFARYDGAELGAGERDRLLARLAELARVHL
jgi:hemerythrin-like domain-containing protein